mgnify:CR=1 FL=1
MNKKEKRENKQYKYTGKQLLELFENYKIERKKDVMYKKELVKGGQLAGQTVNVEYYKPLSLFSFCKFVKIDRATLQKWAKRNDVRIPKDLQKAASSIYEEIKDENLSGAMNGLYNPAVASKIAGLGNIEESNEEKKEAVVINVNGKKIDLSISRDK